MTIFGETLDECWWVIKISNCWFGWCAKDVPMSTHNGETLRSPTVEFFEGKEWRQPDSFFECVFFWKDWMNVFSCFFRFQWIYMETLQSFWTLVVLLYQDCQDLSWMFHTNWATIGPTCTAKNVDNGGVLGLCSCFLSSGLYLLGQPRRITGRTAMMGFATSVRCFPRQLVQVLEYARKHSWLSWSLKSGKRQKCV